MYLSKRNGIYYIFYKKPDGKTTCKSTGAKLKSEALKFLAEFKKEARGESRRTTFGELIFQFLKYSEAIHKPNHTKTLKVTLNRAYAYFGEIDVRSFTPGALQEYFNYRSKKVSVYAVKRDIATFSNIFNFAISQGMLDENPVKSVRKPKLPEKQPLYFKRDEFHRFVSSIDNDDFRDLVLLAVNTGMRQMELLTLTKEQINLKERFVALDNRAHVTKTSKVRSVPLNEKAEGILRKRIERSPIFPFSQNQAVKLFAKYRKISGIRKDLTFHSLRHTFASWLVQRGVPILNVSKLLGHSSVKTTMIYAHVSNKELMESVRAIEN